MDIFSVTIIAIGLSMDCFAVSISKGICISKFSFLKTLRMAGLFGLFQAIMPLISFTLGIGFEKQLASFEHWIAFILLSLIGGKMVYDGIITVDPDCKIEKNPFKWGTLLSLALATSIDALATGVVFIPFPDLIWKVVANIGLISFLSTFLGMYIGIHFGKRFHVKVEIIGGIILIGIGLKILIEHFYFIQ